MTVLVGYVPGEAGLLALRQAARQALWREAELVVVNVVDGAGYKRPTAVEEKELDAAAAELTDLGVRFSVRQLVESQGTVAHALLTAAEEHDAELIVVGINRTSAVAKAVLGSTAQRVLLGARCPVLTVRPRD